ncbi:MAG: hypothetical protein ACKVOB_10405 [Sphingomonas sp.]
MPNTVNTSTIASAALIDQQRPSSRTATPNWFEAFASAWGSALNNQADKVVQQADLIGNQGDDSPSTITLLTAQSLRLSFLSNSAQSSIDAVGKGLETTARKG